MRDPSARTYPEAVAFPYPPKEPTEESVADSEDEDDWEDEPEGCFSASEEDKVEIQARAAALAERDPINEGEDSTDEEELVDSDDDFFGMDENDGAESLILATPVHTGLLSVNKQISETLPIFYRNTTLVLDALGSNCIHFIRSLPRATHSRITSMAITNSPLLGDDGPSRRAWSSDPGSPSYRADDGLTLVTPFAATLAKNLPNLNVFSLYVPWSGDREWYCIWAIIELSMMLKYRCIQQLNHVFFGEKTANALQMNSQDCYEELMGRLADDEKLVEHEFALCDPHGTGPYTSESRKKTQQRMRREDAYVKDNAKPFAWRWADREPDMGTCGNVQAVVACFNDA